MRWVRAFDEPCAVVDCAPPRGGAALAAFVQAEAGRRGLRLEPGVADLLAERVGPQLLLLRSELEKAAPTVLAEYRSSGKPVRILVPVANPERIQPLLRSAAAIARERDGELLLMSAVTVPEQTPLTEGRRYALEKRALLTEVLESAEDLGVPASGIVRIANRASDAILHTIEQHDIDLAVLGWRGHRSTRPQTVFGSTVDRVMREARCDVMVERVGHGAARPIESILVPTAGGPHAVLAGEVAVAFAHRTGAKIALARVVRDGEDGVARAEHEATLAAERRRLLDRANDLEIEILLIPGTSVADAIVEESRNHDITVLGATREGLLQQLLVGAVPEAVAEQAASTVVMVKRYLGVQSLVRRFFSWR